MEYREPDMSLINRPDERRREEARIARASQARPLVEAESNQVFQGDTFSRVTVPNNQSDNITKSIMAVLGPYHSVLGGPSVVGPRPARSTDMLKTGASAEIEKTHAVNDESVNVTGTRLPSSHSGMGQAQVNHKQHRNSSATVKPLNSSASGGDKKRMSSLQSSQPPTTIPPPPPPPSSSSSSSSMTPSKTVKPLLLTTSESTPSLSLSTHPMVVPPASSPGSLAQSPVKPITSKDKLITPKDWDGTKEVRQHKPQQWIPHTSSSAVKQRISTSQRSPKKDANHPQHVPTHSYNPSKPRTSSSTQSSSSSSATTEDRSKHVSPVSMQSSVQQQPPSSKDHNSNTTATTSASSSLSSSPALQMPVTLPTSTISHPAKLSPSAPSAPTPHISPPPAQVKLESSLPLTRPQSSFSNRTQVVHAPRPRSTTPTKTKPHLMNGLTSQHPKLASGTTSTGETSSTSNTSNMKPTSSAQSPNMAASVVKAKSLTLFIPTEKKIPETKSDLINILKEMTELQAPLTAIETPQKTGGEFPFLTAKPSSVVPFSDDLIGTSVKQESKKTTELKTELEKVIKKEEATQNEEKIDVSVLPSAPNNVNSADFVKETKLEEPPEQTADLAQKFSVVGDVTGASRCSSSSSVVSQTSRYRSIGKTMSDDNSILMRDLDLSDEDSDVEPASEEMNISEFQSKKGKVITATADAPNSRTALHMSSSSSTSSSSDSSSESDGDDGGDDDDDDPNNKGRSKKNDADKLSERRLSSSSSSSSSEPDSDGDGPNKDEDDEYDKKDQNVEDIKASVERVDKTPSPNFRQTCIAPVTLGTPSAVVQENPESSLSWRLDHFMQPRRNVGSPASVSPYKSISPPMSQPPVPLKEDPVTPTPDQNRPPTLRDMGQCDTMPFELQAQKVTGYDDDLPDEDDDDETAMFRRKSRNTTSSKKYSESIEPKPSEQSKQGEYRKRPPLVAAENSRSDIPKEVKKFVDPLGKDFANKHSLSTNSSIGDRKKTVSPVASVNTGKINTVLPVAKLKSAPTASSSSSNDEIDVVSYTPDKGIQQASSDKTLINKRNTLESSKRRFNGALSDSSDEDSKASHPRAKNTELINTKRHKRIGQLGDASPASSMPILSSNTSVETSTASPSGASSITSKKDNAVALDHLEAISKPPNLLFPAQSAYSSPSVGSTKPLPPFLDSFSPLHSSTTVMPPYVTLTRNLDGTSRPKIMVQISHNFLSKKRFNWFKEKRDRRRKSQRDTINSESSRHESPSETLRESRIPSISDSRSSQRSSFGGNIKNGDLLDAQRNGQPLTSIKTSLSTAHSLPSKPSLKSSKHKSRDSNSTGLDNLTASNPHSKTPSNIQSSSKETHSSTPSSSTSEKTSSTLPAKSSSSTVDLPTTAAAVVAATVAALTLQTKTTTSASSSPQVVSGKAVGTSAVKNLNFADGMELNADEVKDDKTRQFKRKQDIVDESSKRHKSDPVIDKVNNSIPAAISRHRDSANSTSSKTSHQSNKSRHISASSKKNVNSNNSVDKASIQMSNGPENNNLPFNHYVNGSNSNGIVNSRAPLLPANLPPPSPIETTLNTTQHYLARATEHKHHADNLKDKLAKYEPYLRSCLSFYLAGFSMELSKKEQSYSMYNDTSNLLQYVVRMRANSSSNPESSDKERKLIVLIIRLQAYLNHRMYRLKGSEVSKLKKVIESEQAKYQTLPTTTSTNATSAAVASKPHAPSPHQTNWNKNSTGTPSPMSPTPSPAGSVSSQGSCENVTGKIPNGTSSSSSTPLTSPSPGMVSVHQRVHAVTQKYFNLTSHMVKALELWDQADAERRGFEELFTVLDNACGPLTFHSEPPVVVRYMKHALRLLNL